MQGGSREQDLPDSNGVWELVYQQIQKIKKTSAKRKRRTAKLVARFQGIITGLPYATVVLNGNNEIDWANIKAIDYLNINIKNDRGQRLENLIRIPEMQAILAKNAEQELELVIPQISDRQLALQLIPVADDLKLLIARDISERVQMQQMRKTFIANASHELRTPLTVIAGYLEILRNDSEVPERLGDAVIAASEQSARMQCIIDDLLTLSRLEQSELDDNSSVVMDAPLILESICNDEIALISDDTHSLSVDIDADLKLMGVEAEIVSVFTNLIHNAIRHTRAGTSIQLSWEITPRQEACLVVKDDGQGIAEQHLPHLTKRFYRVDKGRSKQHGGTGLGLAIVQHVIQRHGGHLDIQSTLGKGSVFTVCFPGNRVVDQGIA